jgi:hypothetical protein
MQMDRVYLFVMPHGKDCIKGMSIIISLLVLGTLKI